MLDVGKIKSIIPTLQDIILAFFFTQIQFQLYSKILNKISTKTDNVASSSVHLINLLLNYSVWLIWELIIILGVPLEYLGLTLVLWLVFYKSASNESPIYQFISRQDFLYLYSVNIHTPYLIIFDHIYWKWEYWKKSWTQT